jgi:hypothetical protein
VRELPMKKGGLDTWIQLIKGEVIE